MSDEKQESGNSLLYLPNQGRDRANSRFDQLYEVGEAIRKENAWDSGDVGYICRALVQATLPYREPKGNPPAWGRTNGKLSLVIQPGYYMEEVKKTEGRGRETKQVVPVSLGYPYGSIPRLLLAWIGREVKEKKTREIDLGNSLTKFLGELGINNATGGKNGSITRLKEQSRRLFSAKIAILDNPDINAVDWRQASYSVADKTQIWWDSGDKNPSQSNLFSSRILLSEHFFNELASSPVPVDMRALGILKNNPSALDLYCYLTYSFFSIKRPTTISWNDLMMQFGSEVANPRKFKWQFTQALSRVLQVYDCKVDLTDNGLLLKPSLTSVPRSSRG